MLLVALLVALGTLFAAWAFFTAQRLNRLHIRVDAALLSLGAMLDRRASLVAATLPAIAATARQALDLPLDRGTMVDRARREAELEEELDRVPRPDSVVDAWARVEVARRFYNQAVSDARALRSRRFVRALRLGGWAPVPEFFEPLRRGN